MRKPPRYPQPVTTVADARLKFARRGLYLCAIALVFSYVVAFFSPSARWSDQAALQGFIGLRRVQTAPLAHWIASLADPRPFALLGALLVGVALYRRRMRLAVAAAVMLAGANLSTQLLKPLLAIPRPFEWLGGGAQVETASWPSGHSTAAMSLALCAALVSSTRWRTQVAIAGTVFAVAVGYSVIALGWHYPSDVFGGFLVAAIWALGAVIFLTRAAERWPDGTLRGELGARAPEINWGTVMATAAGFGAAAIIALGQLSGANTTRILSYADSHTNFAFFAAAIAALGASLASAMVYLLRR
jgi:membrane-associated phospholipid phosphatase